MYQHYDIIIIGAGSMGIAAAMYSTKIGKSVCILEKNCIDHEEQNNSFPSSNLNLFQKKNQYNEEYFSKFILESRQQWKRLQQEFDTQFENKLGNLWFGNNDYDGGVGKITKFHQILDQINESLPEQDQLDYLYIERVNNRQPECMKVFKPKKLKNCSALYLAMGGAFDIQSAYKCFLKYVREKNITAKIYDSAYIEKHETMINQYRHKFTIKHQGKQKKIISKKVLIATGIQTPYFLKDIMHYPYLVENNYVKGENNLLYSIEQSVESLIEIQNGYKEIYSHLPAFYNEGQFGEYSRSNIYGQRLCQTGSQTHYVKLGIDQSLVLDSQQQEMLCLSKKKHQKNLTLNDSRVEQLLSYATERMIHLVPKSQKNIHRTSANIFYKGNGILFDYLQRKDKSVMVCSGGCISMFHPLLAKTAVKMLFEEDKIEQELRNGTVVGNFIKKCRFPLKHFVHRELENKNFDYPEAGTFKTVIIGAGCSGLYTAYRLNKQNHDEIGVFDLSQRISGRLKSFKFKDSTVPMQLGGMRYIPQNHLLVNQIVQTLGIPNQCFQTEGDPIQNCQKQAYLRRNHYQAGEWEEVQEMGERFLTAYKLQENVVGMTASQIMALSFYTILTSFENVNLLVELFLSKSAPQIEAQKKKLKNLGEFIPTDNAYYRNWENYVFQSQQNPLNYHLNLTLYQWNQLKPVLLLRYPYRVQKMEEWKQKVPIDRLYPLYKFGFQNVIETQFGHQAYQFITEHNGYYSNTSNASYLDQIMTYLLDFGKVKYFSLSGGFDNINYAMANQLLDSQKGLPARNGGIYLGHKLVNIEKLNSKYLLTFHVNASLYPESKNFYTNLRTGIKRSQFCKIKHPRLGQLVRLPKNEGYFSVQFQTQKLILGMPKKSIQMLCQEIQLLQQPLTSYEPFYQECLQKYLKIFEYSNIKKQKQALQCSSQISVKQKIQRSSLLQKQYLSESDSRGSQSLGEQELETLDQQSKRYNLEWLNSLQIDYDLSEKMKNIFIKTTPLKPEYLEELIESTQMMPSMKIILNFTRNWWDPNIKINEQYRKRHKKGNLVNRFEQMRGVSVTDMPLRQTLYFSSGNENLLLGSYNDMGTTEFWTALQNNFEKQWKPVQGLRNAKLNNVEEKRYSTVVEQPCLDVHRGKQVLVREVLRQLSQMHKMEVKQQWLKQCVYQLWGSDIFGGGYHNFYSGFYIPSVMKCMRKPWLQQNIHFIGEAYSNATGWVEGAFQTAELLLQQNFKLGPLLKGYYPGY